MSGFLSNLNDLLHEQIDRHRNRPLLKAAMASCALAAASTGKVSLCQRVRVDQILETLDNLKVFDAHEGVDLFNDFVEKIRADSEVGHNETLKAVRAVANNKDTATLLVRICVQVSESNGVISLNERAEIENLCAMLEIDPNSTGLYCEQVQQTSLES